MLLLWTYPSTYTDTNTTVATSSQKDKFMYAADTQTALSAWGRYTKCFLPLVSSARLKTNLLLSPFIHNTCSLVHLFWKGSRQAYSPPAFFSSSSHGESRERAADTQGPQPRDFQPSAGYQTPSPFLRIDYRCQLTQTQPGFSALQGFLFFFFFFLLPN